MLWGRGELSWKLRANQEDPSQRWQASKVPTFVAVLNRQGGKTWWLCTEAIALCLRHPGFQVLYGTYSLKATHAIIEPTMAELLEDCPRELRPRPNSVMGTLTFPNGSMIEMAGFDDGRAENYRGRKKHLVIVDEAGFIDDLRYVTKSILNPMLKTTRGRMLMASTPPKTPAHDFVALFREYEARGATAKKTILEDPSVTPEDIDRIAEECGGRDSVHFRREHMCEFIVDEEHAVLPEFTDAKAAELVREFEVPRYFIPHTALDIGWRDYTFDLFAYYDFARGKLCIQDELRIRKMTTNRLADGIREKERALWPGKGHMVRRWGDVNLHVLHDLSVLHGLEISPTAKDDLEAQINQVRLWIQQNRIEIHPRCTNLIRQMHTAVWNRARNKFEQSSTEGHFDGVAALIYLVRNTPAHENPYPTLADGVTLATHFIQPGNEPQSQTAKQLGKLFKRTA
jgi:hypothetical protein